MKHGTRVLVALVVGVIAASLSAAVVSALDAFPTTDDYWLKDTTLKITAYQRTSNGANVQYVEVFNDSDDTPLDLHNWAITGLFTSTSLTQRIALTLQPTHVGLLVPKGHAVIQVATPVQNASFTGTWNSALPAAATLTSLEVTGAAAGYKVDSYVLKTTTNAAKATVFDDFWVRAQISGESYTSTLSSFTATTPIQVYDDGLYETPETFPGAIVEIYPESSDCAPTDTSVLCGDYIKIHVDKNADYSQFVLRTDSNSSSRTTSNTFYLADYPVSADGFITITLDQTGKKLSITNSGGYVWVEDVYGLTTYAETMTRYASAGTDEQGWSWIPTDGSNGQWSTTPEPAKANLITAPVEAVTVCPEGKYLNPDTGRCRSIEEAVNALAACPEGQERNPATNRCRAKVTASTSSLTPCAEGQERNPATNRCRSLVSAVAELIPCDEGYERNPATNRCRKVAGVTTTAAVGPQQVAESTNPTWTIVTWSLIAVAASGAIAYGIYEWRHELAGVGQSIATKFGKK